VIGIMLVAARLLCYSPIATSDVQTEVPAVGVP
jgi:hypothetical protein